MFALWGVRATKVTGGRHKKYTKEMAAFFWRDGFSVPM
jgi:hypothetical protein